MISPRPELRGIPAAEHGGRLAISDSLTHHGQVRHDFSVCLNAFGPADIVTRAIESARVDEYPDPRSRAARRAAAERWNCRPSEVSLGAGAAELIHAVCLAFLRRGDHTLIAEPAFGEYARAAALHGGRPLTVRAPDVVSAAGALPRVVDAIRRTRPRIAFVAAPLSPTGEAVSIERLREIADACRAMDCLLVLDQAYDSFTANPLGTPALPGHTHVLHLRSITKDHALAGLRAAFAVATSDVIDALERVRVPWAASAPAQAAATAAMSDEAGRHVQRTTATLRAEARRIVARCTELGLQTSESSTHYLVIRSGNGQETRELLLAEHGILVRDCASFGLPEWIRVAARAAPDTDVLIAALGDLLANQPSSPSTHTREEE